ncbi:MAG: ABC transporter permease [Eubacteriaceae bacterium]|nr:ABC transporter permease [Eubacteriaceae bacterium]
MFNTETFRLIRRTSRRFLSLTLIVMIGAGFMMGLMSAPAIMRESVDRYYDDYALQDIQLYSQYGFCAEDAQAVAGLGCVKSVFPSRTIDVHATNERGEVSVVRVTELVRPINRYDLVEGRLPEKNGECIMLRSDTFPKFSIGETIVLDYGKNDIFDYLKNSQFTVVGALESPEYMGKILGASNFNNESLDCVILIPNNEFIFEYYTTMYLTLEDADTYISYTKDYDEFVESRKKDIQALADVQEPFLRDRIILKAEEELAQNEALFGAMASSGRAELENARIQLESAGAQIAYYEAQLAEMGALLNRISGAVEESRDLVDTLYRNAVTLEGGMVIFLDDMGVAVDPGFVDAVARYAVDAYQGVMDQYNSLTAQLSAGRKAYEQGLAQYNDAVAAFNSRLDEAEGELRLARQTLDELPDARWMILDRNRQYSTYMYKNTCKQMEAIGRYLPVMFFLVAALVCLTTMKRLVDEQRGQIGIYAALGFSGKQIIMKYVMYALLATVSGGIIGILFGELLFPTVIYNTWRMMYRLPPIKLYYPLLNAAACLLSFGVLMGAVTANVVRETGREVPASLMRPKAPKTAKEILLEKIPFLWKMLSFTSKITARNIFRYKARFLMTVIGVAGCTALLVLGFGLKDSVGDVLDIQYGRIFSYDYQIFVEEGTDVQKDIDILITDENNKNVCSYTGYTTRIYLEDDREDTVNLIVIDPSDAARIFDLTATDKRTPLKLSDEGIIVSEKFAINNGLKKGDEVRIEAKDGLKADVTVADVCEMYFQHYIFMSTGTYRSVFRESPEANVIAVAGNDKESLLNDCSRISGFASLVDFSSIMEQFDTMVQALNLIILVIILVAGSLAFVVLMNLTQVNISERLREIATLKVLGFNDHEINMYIFKEILLLSFIGALLGLPLGIFEHHLIMRALQMEMIMFGMNIKAVSFILSLLITMVFTLIVLRFTRKPLKEVDMVESLKSVE